MTPADLSVVGTENSGAAETEVEYTVAGFGDVEEVRIDLADAADVTIDGGAVSFEGTGTADLGIVNIVLGSVEIDGVTLAGVAFGSDVDVSEVDERTFTIVHDNTFDADRVVPVVSEPNDDGDLAIDADGAPRGAFGVGGPAYFVDPQLVVYADAPLVGVIGDTLEIEVQVEDDGEANADELDVAGIEIEYVVGAVAVNDNATFLAARDVALEQGTLTTDGDGTVTLSLTALGLEDMDIAEIGFRWVAAGDFAGAGNVVGHSVTWYDEVGAPDSLAGATSVETQGVGLNVEVTATVEDANGLPVAGDTVRLTIDSTANRVVPVLAAVTDAAG